MKNLLLFIFLFSFANAQPLIINSNIEINPLPNSEILIPDQSLTLKEAVNNKDWKSTTKSIINFKYSNITRWIRFDIKKLNTDKIFLEYGITTVAVINIYIFKDNKLIKEYKTGLNKEFASRPIDSNKFIFPIDIEKEEIYTIYIESASDLQPNLVSVTLYTEEFFYKRNVYFNFITGVLVSILLFMFFYNLIIYSFIKFNEYKYYLVYILSVIILNITELGYAYKYIYPNQILFNKISIQYFEFLFLFALVIFIKNILEINKKTFLNYFNNILLIILSISIFLSTYLCYTSSIYLTYTNNLNIFLILGILFILSLKIFLEYKKGNIIAKFLIIPWLFPILSIFIYIINRVYFFLDLNILNVIVQLSLIIEAMLMSLIIGLKLNHIEKENNELIIKNKNVEINLLQQSKFASMGKMLSQITHQWKQPLMRINSILLDIDTKLPEDYRRNNIIKGYLDLIENETAYMSKTIRTFTKYFHPHKELEEIYLYSTLIEIQTIYENEFKSKGIFLQIKCRDRNVSIVGYKEEFIQVLLIIFDNALDSFEGYSLDKKELICEIFKENGLSIISIENNGGNIADEELNKIFNPYFTTKNNKNNEGLGLYIAKMIIEESMNKKIEVFNTTKGVKFLIKG